MTKINLLYDVLSIDLQNFIYKSYFTKYVLSNIKQQFRDPKDFYGNYASGKKLERFSKCLANMYNAITDLGYWHIIKVDSLQGNDIFSSSYIITIYNHPFIIEDKNFGLISGFCIRHMEKIAIDGWKEYIKTINIKD